MALPILPQKQIPSAFEHLVKRLPQDTDAALHSLTRYVRAQWMVGSFPPRDWSVFGQTIRTNNDAEAYHSGLNARTQGNVIAMIVDKYSYTSNIYI